MKTKTNELTGAALDWAVAKCEGEDSQAFCYYAYDNMPLYLDEAVHPMWQPSTNWAQGGPIIEREWLHITPWPNESDEDLRWQCKQHDSTDCVAFGPTPLIAAMRCYVASQLGDEVDVPDDIANQKS